jgi:hypothetical protein
MISLGKANIYEVYLGLRGPVKEWARAIENLIVRNSPIGDAPQSSPRGRRWRLPVRSR